MLQVNREHGKVPQTVRSNQGPEVSEGSPALSETPPKRQKAIEGGFTLGRTAIWAIVVYFLIYYGHLTGVAFAGKATEANVVISLLANLQADRWFAYLVGAGGVVYGARQQKIRQRTIRRLTEHTKELEGRMDQNRTSSGLTPTGKDTIGGSSMTESQLAAGFWALAGLCALFAFYLVFRNLRSDDLRDRLFSIRDEMFLYAYDNELINTPAYRNLRVLLNSLIRYAHMVSFARLLVLAAVPKLLGFQLSRPAEMLEWHTSVESLPTHHREKFKEFHTASLLTLWRHLVSGSPLLMTAYILIRVAAPKKPKGQRTKGLRDHLPPIDNFETEALHTTRAA